jgi:hypothetical protein
MPKTYSPWMYSGILAGALTGMFIFAPFYIISQEKPVHWGMWLAGISAFFGLTLFFAGFAGTKIQARDKEAPNLAEERENAQALFAKWAQETGIPVAQFVTHETTDYWSAMVVVKGELSYAYLIDGEVYITERLLKAWQTGKSP